MMLDYFDSTQNENLFEKNIFLVAHEVLTFFDEHYEVDEGGQLVMHPSQAVETWWDRTKPDAGTGRPACP